MRGDGSNHSGEVPKRFLRVLRDETVTAPEHLARMIACREKQRACRIWKFLITLWALLSLFILLCQVAREAVQCSFIISLKHAHNWMQACSLSLTLSQKVKEGEKWSDNRVMWHSQEKEKKNWKRMKMVVRLLTLSDQKLTSTSFLWGTRSCRGKKKNQLQRSI